jgi:hypothetical protein
MTTMNSASSQQLSSSAQSERVSAFGSCFKQLCDMSDENWSLKLLLIDVQHELSLVKIGFRTFEEASDNINKRIQDKLHGPLVYKGGETLPHAED